MIYKCRFIISFILSMIAYSSVMADTTDTTEIGRYLTVSNKPKSSQVDLLSQIIQVRFPQNVQTVGDAINYILRLSGYSLIPNERMSSALKITLTKPLPAIDRNFGPMSLKDALTTLAGIAFNLAQDPLNRTVDFRIKPQFKRVYTDSNKTQHSNS